jgi:glucokinase
MSGSFMGIDIGGTHVEGVEIDRRLKITGKESVSLPAEKDRDMMISGLFGCLGKLCKGRKPAGIGIGVPGAVKDGVVLMSPNMRFLNSLDFGKLVVKEFGVKPAVDNEVNCLAFGEAKKSGRENIVALTLGTGVGGGLIIGGKLYRGRSCAGEIGHMAIDPSGSRCSCGNIGCFEDYVSIRGVRRLSGKLLGREMEPRDVYDLVEKGDKNAKKLWSEYGRLLGLGLSNICYILDPDLIVLGGGIANAFSYFKKSMEEEMEKRLFIPPAPVRKAMRHGNAFGAACLAMDMQSRHAPSRRS